MFIANALANSEIYPPASRAFTVVNPRNGNNDCWGADFVQGNLEDRERTVSLEIPIGDLPTTYTGADVIAWGKAAGKLLP